jgi:ABC-type cobalamin/Fe3+-siderophores transport system ATPase subunit
MLKIIKIENIKGISQKTFNLNIIPNKPSLLVAPNGFGKSSFATAFNSMNNNRIKLHDDDLHNENSTNYPKITIGYEKTDGTMVNLEATNSSNKISGEFDYFVINNQLKPKGIGSQYGKATATATIEIKDVVLVDRIPNNVHFSYSITSAKNQFGLNSKVLPNISSILSNLKLVEKLSENYQALQRANGVTIQKRINEIIYKINSQNNSLTTDILISWIESNVLNNLKEIDYLNTVTNLIYEFDIFFTEAQCYLASIQLIWLYNQDINTFKNACIYKNYQSDKQKFEQTLTTFNCTWKNIRTNETHRQLVVKFPKAILISNGQRDILTFISMLFRAKRHLKKEANILIIDEVFDYLDDANLTAAQYYITDFIDEFKKKGKRIYPLILTHLNPNYFNNYAFNKPKVYFLEKSSIQVNQNLVRLLRNRINPTIEDDVSKFLFHFNPATINKKVEFRALSLPELWGESTNFVQYLNNELSNYLNGQTYDPFAVCGSVRIKIEEIAYNKLQSNTAKTEFINTHKTRNKLEKAEEFGVISPESHYLLGIIYNEGMHWKDNQDNVSPIASKLENLVLKKLIKDVFI